MACLFISCTAGTSAEEDTYFLPAGREKGTLFLNLHTGYYSTSSNYTKIRSIRALSDELSLPISDSKAFMHYMNYDLNLGFTFTEWFEMEVFTSGFWFTQVGNGQELFSFPINIKRGGFSLRSYKIWNNQLKGGFIPELSLSFPFYRLNKTNPSSPILDDASVHFTPSFWLYTRIKNWLHPFVNISFKLKTHDLSSAFQWKAGALIRWNVLEIGAQNFGFWPIIQDKSSFEETERIELLKRTNAGSLKFLSVNPGVVGFLFWAGLNMQNVSIKLSGGMDVFGKFYARGWTAMADVLIQFSPKRKIERLFDEKIHRFTPQIENSPSLTSDPLLEDYSPSDDPLTAPPNEDEEDLLE